MSSPWMKFYPTDWRADPALRMCSIGARGLWMEMLCIMHEAEPYGSLRINSRPVTDRQLASLAGASLEEIDGLLIELEEAGVFSRDEDGAIVSRRMQRDKAKADTDKANGKRGGNPKIAKGVNPSDNGEDKAQKPEARDQITEADASDAPLAVDARSLLWRDGVSILRDISGKTEPGAKALIGKWLKASRDDCAIVMSKITAARDNRIGEPIAWISAALDPPKPASRPGVVGAAQRILESENHGSEGIFGDHSHAQFLPPARGNRQRNADEDIFGGSTGSQFAGNH